MTRLDHKLVNYRVIKAETMVVKIAGDHFVFLGEDCVDAVDVIVYFELEEALLLLLVELLSFLHKLRLKSRRI